MTVLVLASFAFLAGLVCSGVAATLFELHMGRQVQFAEPFVSSSHLPRSIAVTLLAGPFMLGNDALAAWRAGGISQTTLLACACAAVLWLVATGIVLIGLVSLAGTLLG